MSRILNQHAIGTGYAADPVTPERGIAMPAGNSATQPQERLHGLDALRGIALLLGVVLHATMSFLPGQPFWIITDTDRSTTLGVAFHVIHMFRMTAFFLIAGFFAHMAFHRLGARAFMRDRLKRIGIPLVAGWPVLFVGIVAVVIWAAVVTQQLGLPAPKEVPPPPAFTPTSFPLTHLWFLYVLLLFYAAAVAIRSTINTIDRDGRLRAMADSAVRVVTGPAGPMLLAIPTALSLYNHPGWVMWFGIPTPDHSLIPNLAATVVYGTAFSFGWLLHRQSDLLRRIEGAWLFNLVVALAATIAGFVQLGVAPTIAPAVQDTFKWSYAACYSLGVWSWTFAAIGIALRFFSGFSPARRYLADASYWIYLVHLPLVMALQVVMARFHLPALIEFMLLLAVAFALMLASYHLFVRFSFIGATLNGRRKERARKSPSL